MEEELVAPLGPAAAVASLPSLLLPFRMAFTPFSDMTSRMKSVEEPPICRPALTPLIRSIAGADHLPLKFLPVRQVIGPRPPLPPMPKPNFFTLGSTITQFAFARRLE